MASTTVHGAATARTAAFNGTSVNTLLGATASLRIYSGSVPADADASLGAAVLLATLPLAATPVSGVASGVATLGTITSAAAAAAGTASFWRILDSSAVSQYQGEATATGGGGSLLLATVSIVAAATISCSAGSITLPA